MKICTKCGFEKHLIEFHRDSSMKDGLRYICKPCAKLKTLAWKRANPDRAKASVKAWLKANPERKRTTRKAWAKANSEKMAISRRFWVLSNPERMQAARRAWRVKNPEASQTIEQRYRANKAAVDNTLTAQEWLEILASFNHTCAYCLRPGLKLTMDHVVPISKGGPHSVENVVPACTPCNSRKGNRGILSMLPMR